MKGTIVNCLAIAVGSGLGLVLKSKISPRYQDTIMQGLGLSVLLIGLTMAIETQNVLVVAGSMIIGAVIGELLDIDGRLNRIGDRLSARLQSSGGSLGKGFVTATLVYCIGAMAIVGSLQDGLTGDASTLYAKAMLDGTGAVIFTATLGIGVILSVIPVLLYQGSITLLAAWVAPLLTDAIICEVTAVGGLLILGIGLNLLKICQIKIANLLPAVFAAGFLCAI